MIVEKATIGDLDKILEIYADARSFMRASGNADQWINGYPSRDTVMSDIAAERLYKVTSEGCILGVFCYFFGRDKTYDQIYDGKWLNDLPYGVIHRIAVSKSSHGLGVSAFCFRYALDLCGNLKIDTHRDNIPMQRALSKFGFSYCGIIHLESGDERLAYQIAKKP